MYTVMCLNDTVPWGILLIVLGGYSVNVHLADMSTSVATEVLIGWDGVPGRRKRAPTASFLVAGSALANQRQLKWTVH